MSMSHVGALRGRMARRAGPWHRGACAGRERYAAVSPQMGSQAMESSWEKPLHGNRTRCLIVEYGNGQRVPLLWTTMWCDQKASQVQGGLA